ncbi:MAG: hypothetical protein NTY68_00685 [Candidatus Micrarchaeota archaeon]|nr:hypothetical protein [Candidatus Micrarchaeota archaeon]
MEKQLDSKQKKSSNGNKLRIFEEPLSEESCRKNLSKFIDSSVSLYKNQERAENEEKRNSAHNSGHMLRAAIASVNYIEQEIPILEAKSDIMALSMITGLVHDMVRMPREVNGRSDGHITADLIRFCAAFCIARDINYYQGKELPPDFEKAYLLLNEKYNDEMSGISHFLLMLKKSHIEDIASAIEVNELKESSAILAKANEWQSQGLISKAALQNALLYADKGTEGIGKVVVIRRFQFVSGERAENRDDIGMLRGPILSNMFSEEEFRMLAFIGESMIRIYSNKSLDDLPDTPLWKSVKENRNFEEMVYYSLLKNFFMIHPIKFKDEKSVLDYLYGLKFPKLDSKTYEKISSKMRNVDLFSDLTNHYQDASLNQPFFFGVALAYSQSKDPEIRKMGERYKSCVTDAYLKACFEDSNTETLVNQLKDKIESI